MLLHLLHESKKEEKHQQGSQVLPSRHMTLIQRRLNVDATSWRCIDVEPTLYKRHVPAGLAHAMTKITQKSVISEVSPTFEKWGKMGHLHTAFTAEKLHLSVAFLAFTFHLQSCKSPMKQTNDKRTHPTATYTKKYTGLSLAGQHLWKLRSIKVTNSPRFIS